jgi:IMP dehydrogenase
MSIESQAVEVDKVKKSESGMIVDPVTIHPETPVHEVLEVMTRYRISGVPVTKGDRLVGIVTNRDLRFETNGQIRCQRHDQRKSGDGIGGNQPGGIQKTAP